MSQPSRRDRFKPAELIALSAVIALFAGGVAFLATRDLVLGLISFGITFIVSLVTIALLILVMKPDDDERSDLVDQDQGH